MPTLISGVNCFEAWRLGASHIAGQTGCEAHDLVVEIEDTQDWDPAWFSRIDPRRVSPSGENPDNVANTIFPQRIWDRAASRSDLYARYAAAHGRSRNKKWGSYFLRLIDFGISHKNQLESAIEKIETWPMKPRNAICFHLSSPEMDSIRLRGGPCLQAIQLHIIGNELHFSVFYRNHDYFNKALPNFVGLGRLQRFLCDETSLEVGRLVCYSTHAYANATKSTLRLLLAR